MKTGLSSGGVILIAATLILSLTSVGAYLAPGGLQYAEAQPADAAPPSDTEGRISEQRARAGVEVATADDDGEFSTEPTAAIEAVIQAQEEAWNRGDIDAFVEHYWKSNDVTFSSGGKTTRGWAETLTGYRERYPTPEKMGQVKFSNLEITRLGDAAALVLGNWQLQRDSEPLSGNFSLVFRKLDGRWVIIHDHTSRLMD